MQRPHGHEEASGEGWSAFSRRACTEMTIEVAFERWYSMNRSCRRSASGIADASAEHYLRYWQHRHKVRMSAVARLSTRALIASTADRPQWLKAVVPGKGIADKLVNNCVEGSPRRNAVTDK